MKIVLASPRGFCAGVTRAIETVENALKLYPHPVYIRHEIVHNKTVVNSLKERGAVFVSELDEIPSDKTVIFSAHGVPQNIYESARKKKLHIIDATCPLVKKIHKFIQKHYNHGDTIILVGHKNHVEVIGSKGQVPPGGVYVVKDQNEIDKLPLDKLADPANGRVFYTTQTTLSLFDTEETIKYLKKKIPHIKGQRRGGLCYATYNRQKAVASIARKASLMFIAGSLNSSNSNRLREIAASYIPFGRAFLVENETVLEKKMFEFLKQDAIIGISGGASAPETVIRSIIKKIIEWYPQTVLEEHVETEENLFF